MEVTKEIIKEIAENLESGFRCFINRDTGELITIPNEDNFSSFERGMWQNEMRTIKKSRKQLIEIEGMSSADSFRFMEQFISTVQDKEIKERLKQALGKNKPFMHFKLAIDSSGNERDRWFEFKQQRFIEWVKNQIAIP